jgi:glycosyltransferase involved in cell wall biosynthesis
MRLTDTIIFYDNVKDMPTLYNISDAQIFYVREMTGKVDIPYALIEPMACGKPIIVSDLPVLTEITNKNAAGITIATADSQSLAKCLIDLINNPQQLKKMGEEALSFIQENFDIRKNVKEYEKIYKRLAA